VIRTQLKTYHRPDDLKEALILLQQGGKTARLIGGGIDLALHLPPDVTALIDLSRLPLSSIEESSDGITIGATATMTEVLEHPAIASYLNGVIVTTLLQVASPLLRNLATIGGTLVSTHPWSDVIPLFLALGAEVTLVGEMSERIPLSDLYDSRERLKGKILTVVHLPKPAAGTAAAFRQFSRTGFDVALLNCACFVRVENGRCIETRIIVGGTPRLASSLPKAEESLIGAALTEEAIERTARIAQESSSVGDDRRASAGYRRELVYVGVKRSLSEIKDQLEEAKR